MNCEVLFVFLLVASPLQAQSLQDFFTCWISQDSMSVITKHRSSSIRLNRVARKIDALELASGRSEQWVGYVKSSANPSDDTIWLIYDHAATHS